MFKNVFCSLKQKFVLQIDFSGIINSDTFSVVPFTINASLKNVLFHCSTNEGKSAANFWCQVRAWFPDMLCKFYFVKHHKIAKKNSTTTNTRQKYVQICNP
jgi:hypothetical protein